ncbi:MAG: hypothetical protein H6559_24900 [Lewinellaceae bacterium]|nr:hypothetical protein [Lewinellaceae bacterium]
MNDAVFTPKFTPLQLLEKLSMKELKERTGLMKDEKDRYDFMLKQVAEIARQFWHMKQALAALDETNVLNQEWAALLKTAVINIEAAFARLHIKLEEIGSVPLTETVGKNFRAITQLPSDEVEVAMVGKMISPAVFQNEQLIIRGEIQILTPAKLKNP